MVILEKFDHSKFTVEKVGFQVSGNVYNVSEGLYETHGDDYLRCSYLWRGRYSNEEFRLKLWNEIKKYLPRYLRGDLFVQQKNWRGEEVLVIRNCCGFYFNHLITLAEKIADGKEVKLLYLSDRDHAELIKRCIEWLAQQIVF